MKLFTPEQLRPEEIQAARASTSRRKREPQPRFEVVVREDGQEGEARWSELVELLLEVGSQQ